MPGSAPARSELPLETASDAVTPEGLEERLRQRVLAGGPPRQKSASFVPGAMSARRFWRRCWPSSSPSPPGRRCCWAGIKCSPGGSAKRLPDPHGPGGAAGRLCLQRLRRRDADGAGRLWSATRPSIWCWTTSCRTRWTGRGSSSTQSQGYDPETNTLTYLLSFTTTSQTQPLTLLVGPPAAVESGRTATALADHPAILTFQPECIDAQTLTGEVAGDRMRIQVVLSPFAMQVEFYGYNFTEPMELLRSTTLVFRDGTAVTAGPADLLSGRRSPAPAPAPLVRS